MSFHRRHQGDSPLIPARPTHPQAGTRTARGGLRRGPREPKVTSVRCICRRPFTRPIRTTPRNFHNALQHHLWSPTHALDAQLAHATAKALITLTLEGKR